MDQPNSAASQRNYEQRLSRVTRYIYEHLDDTLDLIQLAEIACMSPYHWHRIYQAIYGESVVACVKRLRLHRAANYLSNSSKKLSTIAVLSGYPNLQSFNRTFSAMYGIPPARFRKKYSQHFLTQDKGAQQNMAPEFFNHQHFSHFSESQRNQTMYPVSIINSAELSVLAVEHQGAYMNIGEAFDILNGCAASRNLFTQSTRWFGVFLDDPCLIEAEKLRSWACISAPEILHENALSEPISLQKIKAGKFAVLRYQGPYSNLSSVYQWLYGIWLPASGLETEDAPVFEDYLNNPRDTAPNDLLTDIYLPIK